MLFLSLFLSFALAQETAIDSINIAPTGTDSYTKTLAWSKHRNARRYTEAADKAIRDHATILYQPRGRAHSQIKNICPRFDDLPNHEKKYVWIHIASEVALHESELDQERIYRSPDFNHYGLYGQLIQSEGHEKACHKSRQSAFDVDNASECFFRLMSEKLSTSNCLVCRIESLDLLWLSREREEMTKLRNRLREFTPCHESALVSLLLSFE